MVRADVDNTIQLGVESTPGTPVAATKRFTSLSLALSDKYESKKVRSSGRRFSQRVTPIKKWTEYGGSGDFNYNEAPYIFCSLIKNVSPTVHTDADSGAATWVWTANNFGPDGYKAYTIERGPVPGTGERSSYSVFTGAELAWSRGDLQWASADVVARNLLLSHTMTETAVDIPDETAEPGDINVYRDASSAALGTTQALTSYEGAWRLKGRRGPAWTVNRSNESWAHLPDLAPALEADLTIEDDSTAAALIAARDSQDTQWIRVDFLGPLIAGTKYYSMQIDMACKVLNVGEPGVIDGVSVRKFTFEQVYDSTWGKPFQITLVNALTAL